MVKTTPAAKPKPSEPVQKKKFAVAANGKKIAKGQPEKKDASAKKTTTAAASKAQAKTKPAQGAVKKQEKSK